MKQIMLLKNKHNEFVNQFWSQAESERQSVLEFFPFSFSQVQVRASPLWWKLLNILLYYLMFI